MITAYVKPTNFCNVGCSHCYLPEAARASRFRMPIATLAAAARLLAEMRAKTRRAHVHVLWHGGEPLTVPVSWYAEAGAVLDEILPGHSQSVQTSLIPLRDEHIPLVLGRFGGHVGSSVDFSQRRIGGSVEAYHDLWMAKVEAARRHGVLVTPGVVPTVGDLGREGRIVDWFMERGFAHFNVDRYNAYAAAFPDRPSNRQHALFLIGLFDAMMERLRTRGWAPLCGAVQGAITGVLFQRGGDRWGGSCMSDFVVVEPDGALNNCADKSTVEEPFANAADGYDAFARSKFRRKWIRHQNVAHKMEHCQACPFQAWCRSGCPITPNGAPEGEDECSGYRTFLAHVAKAASDAAGRGLALSYLDQARRDPRVAAATAYGGPPTASATTCEG